MADKTTKPIKDVKSGDSLASAITGKNTVLFVDTVSLDGRKLVGAMVPFVTEDHCFYGPNGERLAYNVDMAIRQKHWDVVYPATGLLVEDADPATPVYDVVTSDHTLIVNGIKFYDDMPEVTKHPLVAVACALLGKTVYVPNRKDKIPKRYIDNLANDVYTRGIRDVLKDVLNDDLSRFDDSVAWFMKMANDDPSCLHVCSSLWKHKFWKIKNEINKLTRKIKMIEVKTKNVYLYRSEDEQGLQELGGTYEPVLKRWAFSRDKKDVVYKFVEQNYPDYFDSDNCQSSDSDNDSEIDRRLHRAKSFSEYESDSETSEKDSKSRSRSRSQKFKAGCDRSRPKLTNKQFTQRRNAINAKTVVI
jgi:hypothetical protein